MPPHTQDSDEIHDLAGRFLRVLRNLGELIRYPEPEPDIEYLDLNHLRVIHLLRDRPQLSQAEIAELLDLGASHLSATLQKLLAMRLVRYQPEKRDGLTVHYFLTLRGQKVAFNAEAMLIIAARKFLNALTVEEQRTLIGTLERMIAAHQQD